MTVITFETARRMAKLASALRAVLKRLAHMRDLYVTYRIRRSVSQLEPRHRQRAAERDRRRCTTSGNHVASSTPRLPHARMVPRWTSSLM
jgi:hypothetical protein